MNLIALTALVAVCGAAKLDRSYLPPLSAKTAGGSPGAIQTPFAGNSFNNGLGGLPKGSYENEFQGVVVDAAAAGTRTSEGGESGLGAPRISYGSTDSKVGAAAFKTRPTFGQTPVDEETSGTSQFEQASQGFQQGSFQGSSAQQGLQGSSAPQGFQSTQPERPRAALDRGAGILRFENEVGPESYHFAYETDNGITAEENGVATNGVQAQGGYSYTGDDGQVYSVSYTADEKGYQPKGAHLPTPPPIPVEILKSLEQNARDEAAGLSDDGSYDAQKYNAGSDYTESNSANGKFSHQSSKFDGSEADATASSTFIDQNNQPFARPGQREPTSSSNIKFPDRFSQENSGVDSNGASNIQNTQEKSELNGNFGQADRFSSGRKPSGQFSQSGFGSNQANGFGTSSSTTAQRGPNNRNGFGNRNEYLPPTKRPGQKDGPKTGIPNRSQSQISSNTAEALAPVDKNSKADESGNFVPLGQQDLQSESRPQEAFTSFGQPISADKKFSSSQIKPSNGRRPNGISSQVQSQSGNNFARPNEYLPPNNNIRKPINNRPENVAGYTQTSKDGSQEPSFGSSTDDSNSPFGSQSQSNFGSTAQTSFASQPQQTNGFRTPQSSRPSHNNNRFQSQNQMQFVQSTSNFGFTQPIKTTSQPDTELTTPFETDNDNATPLQFSQNTASVFGSASRPANRRPTQSSFGNQFVNSQNTFGTQSSAQPQSKPGAFAQTQPTALPTASTSGQVNQNSQFNNQPQSFFNQNNDGQFASSTQRPAFSQQAQGPDNSYYYNQPSKPFNTQQNSRFPSASSNEFDRGNQQSSFAQNRFSGNSQEESNGSGQFQMSTKYPQPPTIAPTASFSKNQFGGEVQSSTKYPSPPTIAPTFASNTQYQGNAVNGVTQASISSFPSQFPTQSVQGQFDGSKPSFQSQVSQSQETSSFNQKPAQSSFGQQPTTPSFPKRPTNSFSSQSQSFNQQSQTAELGDDKDEQAVSSQQYNGEIYEYNKPAQTLPSPDSTPTSMNGQFGQKVQGQGQFGFQSTRPQFGQTNDVDDQRPSQFEVQNPQSQDSRPQFGGQSRPQFGQTQSQNQFGVQSHTDSKPYGALAQNQNAFGTNTQSAVRPQSGSQSQPQFGQNFFASQSQTTEEPQGLSQSQFEQTTQSSRNQFGFIAPCCGQLDKKPQSQNQFGQNFAGSQSFKPEPTSSFAGQGEQFGGPRQPPSFNEQTGYHY